MLSRFRYKDYDPQVWLAQTLLSDVGISPGTIDGLWGPATLAAAQQFYQSQPTLAQPLDTTQGSILTDEFMTTLEGVATNLGITIPFAPASLPSSGGGSSASPAVVAPASSAVVDVAPSPAPSPAPGPLATTTTPPSSNSWIWVAAAIGGGTLLWYLMGSKKKRA